MPETPRTFKTIGILVGRDLVGDGLMKLPFLRSLRRAFPEAHISWITSQGPTAFSTMLRVPAVGLIDAIVETPPWLAATGASGGAPAPRFDLLLDTRNRWKEARLARKSVPHDVYISPAMRYLFSERRPSLFTARPVHICDRLLQMVELAAGSVPPCTGSVQVPDDLKQKARRILPEGRVYVGFAPGAGNAVKIWPRERVESVAVAQAAKGRVPAVILGPQELDWQQELRTKIPGALFPLQDSEAWGEAKLGIEHTLAVAACLDAAVANDSGVSHMLAAQDCALVSLFGPTSPEKLAPRVSIGAVVRAQDFGSAHMDAIPWQAVDAAIDDLLARKSR